MKEYLKEAITNSGMDVSKVAPTPARKDLFTVDDVSEQLDKRQGESFHSIVAKLLYVSKRARTDAQLAIAFLCTRVSSSTEQDWKKLIRLLQYFNGTYAVHDDMKSHTGGATSLGRGAIMCKSTKQKLIQRVLLKPKLSVQVIIYLTLSGPGCFWPNKGTSLPKTFFTRITRALSDLRRMVEHPAGRSLATSAFVISSCRTVSSPRAFPSSTVPRTKCLPISLRSLSKAVCFGNSGAFFSVIAMWIRSQNLRYLHPRSVLRIRYWRKFDLEVADRRLRYQPRKKCPNRWRSHLLPRMCQFLKRASNGHQ